ncbi:cyclic lactone autoinducer peptide [Clostridiaceae bacterium 35-E11]
MKKVMQFLKGNSLMVLTFVGLFMGSVAVTTQTMVFTHQVKCPNELLK